MKKLLLSKPAVLYLKRQASSQSKHVLKASLIYHGKDSTRC